MKTKMLILLFTIFYLAGCGKESAPPVTPDPLTVDQKNDSERLKLGSPDDINIPSTPENSTSEDVTIERTQIPQVSETETVTEKIETTSSTIQDEPVIEPIASPQKPIEIAKEPITVVQESITTPIPPKPTEIEPFKPDSTWEDHMILPGDFLIKIARNEYGDWRMWRKIYAWNKEGIGPDPNLIYPYHFLDLLKPREVAKNCEVRYTSYQVVEGDNLWNIAGEIYGDEKSWIILFWDNEEIIDENDGSLYPGMVIKLREKLDPCS